MSCLGSSTDQTDSETSALILGLQWAAATYRGCSYVWWMSGVETTQMVFSCAFGWFDQHSQLGWQQRRYHLGASDHKVDFRLWAYHQFPVLPMCLASRQPHLTPDTCTSDSQYCTYDTPESSRDMSRFCSTTQSISLPCWSSWPEISMCCSSEYKITQQKCL